MKSTLSIASISGLICVVLGAFGAHALKPLLSIQMLAVYETGVRYQFYHTLAIILIVVLYQFNKSKNLVIASYFFFAGILLFSGSLYLLALTSIHQNSWTWLGPITPLGGLCFIIGWVYLFLGAKKLN
jgi:uncharacterized membrane protein YgdD (TMEM256/DUF423 family)